MAKDKMTLGENVILSTDSNKTGLNNNVIVCGSSGSGKSMSILEPRLLETNHSSLIVTVTKRRLAKKYIPVFQNRGYIVEDLNFVHPMESTVAYDPLKYVRDHQDIKYLAEAIVMANPKKQTAGADPYWYEAAISLLSAEIALVLMKNKKATFVDVLNLHDKLDFKESPGGLITTTLDKTFDNLIKEDPDCFVASCWKSFRRLPATTAGCVFSSLNTTIDTIFSPELREMIAMGHAVDFESLSRQKTILFVSTSAVNPALNCFVNIFYAQVFKSLFEYAESLPNGKLPIPVHVLCDDFASGSKILNFPDYISIFREKEMSVTLLIQSESQLERMYGSADATIIIDNCDTYVFMGGMDLKTGRSISERLNRPLEDVLYMPIGQEYVFRRGQDPIITTRYNISKDRRYLSIKEPVCLCPECKEGSIVELRKGLYRCSSCETKMTKSELQAMLCIEKLQNLCENRLERQKDIKEAYKKVIAEIKDVNEQILEYKGIIDSLDNKQANEKEDADFISKELRDARQKLLAAETRLEKLSAKYRSYEKQLKWIVQYNNASSIDKDIG